MTIYRREASGVSIEWNPNDDTAAAEAFESVTGEPADSENPKDVDAETAQQIRQEYAEIVED